jgi:hypothetical protein
MPKGKTKTSLIKAKNTGAVPAICISKPPGIGCLLQKYTCEGKFTGIIQPPVDTIEGCQQAAAGEKDSKIVMVWNNTGQKQFIIENFDNCTPAPPPANVWNLQTATETGQDERYSWTGGSVAGIVNCYSDEYGFLFCSPDGFGYRFATDLITGDQLTQLFFLGTETPNTEYPGWSGGTWEAVDFCEA